MKTQNTGGPAFPQHGWSSNPEILARMQENCGMTLRDYYAGKALQGLLSNTLVSIAFCENSKQDPAKTVSHIANRCFALADAMIEERSKHCPKASSN